MELKIENISFGYTTTEVLNSITFSAQKGEYIAVVGESGCGKSTLLEIIYGLLHLEKGAVYWKNEKLLGPRYKLIPGEEFMKYLPQDFDLMPYISVGENIGKHISNLDPQKQQKILELLEVVNMTDFIKTKVKYLSGGQKQRVALAKVLAKEPEVLLLDEPFSHIDNFRKNKLRRDLFRYLKSKNILCIVATHDTTDALSFADKIVVLKDGSIVAQDTPESIYNNQKSEYIACFFNEISEIPFQRTNCEKDSENTILLYPNQLKIVEKSKIKAQVIHSYFKGTNYLIEANLNGNIIFLEHNFKLKKNKIIYIEIVL